MPSVQSTAPRSNTRGDSLADILERVLDTGIVIAGDIRVQLADIELLTIQIRLIICSVDKAQQLGMDWWKGASFLSSDPIPTPGLSASGASGSGASGSGASASGASASGASAAGASTASTPAADVAATHNDASSETPQELGYETPSTVSSMQEQFGANARPSPAQQPVSAQQPPPQTQTQSHQQGQQPVQQHGQQQGQQQGQQPVQQQGQQPSWQAPNPSERRPWNQPSPDPTQARAQASPTPRQDAPQAAQSAPVGGARTDASAVQVELLNERLARLEAVLERLVPPES